MKHLKKFENFNLGRFSEEEYNPSEIEDMDDCTDCGDELEFDELEEEELEDEEMEMKTKVWGDEMVEKLTPKQEKKLPEHLKKAILKNKEKAEAKKGKDKKVKK